MSVLPPGLHVILGDSAAATFRQVFHPAPDQLVIDRDVLSCGPTRACPDIASWRAMRYEFWSTLFEGPLEHVPSQHELLNTALRDAERITVWAATGLSEQLFVAHVIHRAEAQGVGAARLFVVRFENLTDRSDSLITGMGELIPAQMAGHLEPVNLSPEALQDYRDVWAALTSDDPALIERFAEAHPDANPWLRRVTQLMLRRFPDRQSGLPHWDRLMLGYVAEGQRKAARVIGSIIGDCSKDGDHVGDLYLYARLLRLGDSGLPKPLIEMAGDTTSMRATEVQVTPFGLDVLEGRASNYPTNPIEDWVAGCRLSSADGTLWFNDNGRLVPGRLSLEIGVPAKRE